jgi:hypothetical protein
MTGKKNALHVAKAARASADRIDKILDTGWAARASSQDIATVMRGMMDVIRMLTFAVEELSHQSDGKGPLPKN